MARWWWGGGTEAWQSRLRSPELVVPRLGQRSEARCVLRALLGKQAASWFLRLIGCLRFERGQKFGTAKEQCTGSNLYGNWQGAESGLTHLVVMGSSHTADMSQVRRESH